MGRPKPHRKTDVELRKARQQSEDDLWKTYFRLAETEKVLIDKFLKLESQGIQESDDSKRKRRELQTQRIVILDRIKRHEFEVSVDETDNDDDGF